MFKKDLTPLGKKGKIVINQGKGGKEGPMLPSRAAMPSLTRPGATMNDYAKATPGLAQQSPGLYDDWDNDGM